MKSVDIQRQRARRLMAGIACSSVIVGFIACSGSTEHKTGRQDTPYSGAGAGEGGSAQAGAGAVHTGGSISMQGGEGGEALGGVPGVAGAAGEAGVAGEVGTAGAAGDVGAGGQSQGGAGGQAAGGEAAGGNGGEGGELPVIDLVCGVNMAQVGTVSEWCGKVDVHTNADGLFVTDTDCTSGCRQSDVERLDYCKKFYPSATAIQKGLVQGASGSKDWKNAGFVSGTSGPCNDSAPDGPGISGEFACCAPFVKTL
jgi:hypothetical protein